MISKILSAIIVVLIVNLSAFAVPTVNKSKDAKFAAKVKAEISKLGTGESAKIEVKLKDGTKLKGYVSEINNDNFVIANAATSENTSVAYPQVQKAKGNSLNTAVKIAIGVGIIFGVVVILILIAGAQGF